MKGYVFYDSWNNTQATQAAMRLQRQGKYEAALESYCKALEIDPSDCVIWYDQGALLASLGRYEEAIVSYDKAISLKLNQSSQESLIYYAWANKGYALCYLGRYDEAFASLDKALKLNPNNSCVWEYRSNLLQHLGRYEDALTSIDKALEVGCYPYAEFLVWEQRAILCNYLKRFDDEAKSYEQAIERYEWVGYLHAALYLPVDYNVISYLFRVWQSRGVALIKAKRYEDAIVSLDTALTIYQDNKELCSSQSVARAELYYFWHWRADVLNCLHRYDDARISFEQADAVESKFYIEINDLYQVEMRMGRIPNFSC